MNTQNISLTTAFIAGLLSFLSPCVLPLVPVYLGYMTGTAIGSFQKANRPKTLIHALFFVVGFSIIFVLLGAAAGLIGNIIYPIMPYVAKVGGLILIIFGLHTTGLVPIPFLNLEKRLEFTEGGKSYWSSLLVGMIFAAGWTPCVGPVLSGILLMAADSQTVGAGAMLLAGYALGLGLPFLIVAGVVDTALPVLRKMNRHLHTVSVVAGSLLIAMGILLLTGLFDSLVFWLNSTLSSW